jgi:hypothetical protein
MSFFLFLIGIAVVLLLGSFVEWIIVVLCIAQRTVCEKLRCYLRNILASIQFILVQSFGIARHAFIRKWIFVSSH